MLKVEQKSQALLLLSVSLITFMLVMHFINMASNAQAINNSANNSVHNSVINSANNLVNSEDAVIENAINAETVKAEHYEQFWLWTPPREAAKISQAHTLYLLQGEIRPKDLPYYHTKTNSNLQNHAPATLTPQGLGVRSLKGRKIWLVYRATSREWSDEVMPQLIKRLGKWQRAGNQVMGIQIDYDAPTYKLDKYAQLLADIRKQLPAQYQLSVTGLLDWSNQAEDAQFMQLNHTVDELVVQTYQGTTTLSNYDRYLKKLENLPFDFKVGIIEGGEWQGAEYLNDNPHFKGYVVFLR